MVWRRDAEGAMPGNKQAWQRRLPLYLADLAAKMAASA